MTMEKIKILLVDDGRELTSPIKRLLSGRLQRLIVPPTDRRDLPGRQYAH